MDGQCGFYRGKQIDRIWKWEIDSLLECATQYEEKSFWQLDYNSQIERKKMDTLSQLLLGPV